MSAVKSFLRCPGCKLEVFGTDVREEDYLDISTCCDEVCEKVWLCDVCGEREQHKGCDQCFECVLDEAVADPRIIDQCMPELQAEIAKGLAERLSPFLRKRQAA